MTKTGFGPTRRHILRGGAATVALAAGLARGGAFHLGNIALSTLAIIPSLLGMWAGTAIRERISATTLRRWFLIFLAVLGLELVVRPLFF